MVVGAAVSGFKVGTIVVGREVIGSFVGCTVGDVVEGISLGFGVGCNVVGHEEGLRVVGSCVGIRDGDGVGFAVKG